MSLRLKANLLFAALILFFVSAMMMREINNTRRSVWEEIEASNRVATQVLRQAASMYRQSNQEQLKSFLKQLGRVRANEIVFKNQNGETIYQSPPSPYKQGRFAPKWFANIITPEVSSKTIELPTGLITVTPDASRAILDGWEDLSEIAIMGLLSLLITNFVVFFLIGRWLSPFEKIKKAIESLEQGNHHIQIQKLYGKEARSIGQAFNSMVNSVNETIQAKEAAAKAQAQLHSQREFSQQLQNHIEGERKDLARELHDEMGQSLTAIRSIATSIAHQTKTQDPQIHQSAQLLIEAAGQTYDAMHRLIPKLRPIALDQLGLEGALNDLVVELQKHHPHIQFQSHIEISKKDDAQEIALYRIAQEGINNAIKHAQATFINVSLNDLDKQITLTIENDGISPEGPMEKSGHYGIEGMKERANYLHGDLSFINPPNGGLIVNLKIKSL